MAKRSSKRSPKAVATPEAKPKKSADPSSRPCTPETALALLTAIGLTEDEAQALLDAPPASESDIEAVLHVNLHAIAATFSRATVRALDADDHLDLPFAKDRIDRAATNVRTLSSATDKLESLHGRATAAAKVDADRLEKTGLAIVAQVRARTHLDDATRDSFAPVLSYHHARYPGGRRRLVGAPPATGSK